MTRFNYVVILILSKEISFLLSLVSEVKSIISSFLVTLVGATTAIVLPNGFRKILEYSSLEWIKQLKRLFVIRFVK